MTQQADIYTVTHICIYIHIIFNFSYPIHEYQCHAMTTLFSSESANLTFTASRVRSCQRDGKGWRLPNRVNSCELESCLNNMCFRQTVLRLTIPVINSESVYVCFQHVPSTWVSRARAAVNSVHILNLFMNGVGSILSSKRWHAASLRRVR